MPELLEEMCKDLAEHPLKRDFVLLKKTWTQQGTWCLLCSRYCALSYGPFLLVTHKDVMMNIHRYEILELGKRVSLCTFPNVPHYAGTVLRQGLHNRSLFILADQ